MQKRDNNNVLTGCRISSSKYLQKKFRRRRLVEEQEEGSGRRVTFLEVCNSGLTIGITASKPGINAIKVIKLKDFDALCEMLNKFSSGHIFACY